METSKITGLPQFYYYDKNPKYKTDAGYESVMDFSLRWLFHCADEIYKTMEEPKLHEYAKHTIFFLIHGNNENDEKGTYSCSREINNEFKVVKVETMRQWNGIDLVAELDIEDKSGPVKYVLNIENKFHTDIGNGQLEKYKKVIKNEYENKRTIVDLCIFIDDSLLDASQKQICIDTRYKFLTIGNIGKFTQMENKGVTNNPLFDEFWFSF